MQRHFGISTIGTYTNSVRSLRWVTSTRNIIPPCSVYAICIAVNEDLYDVYRPWLCVAVIDGYRSLMRVSPLAANQNVIYTNVERVAIPRVTHPRSGASAFRNPEHYLRSLRDIHRTLARNL